jgi:hypothetical protein
MRRPPTVGIQLSATSVGGSLGGRKHVSSDVMDRAKDNQIRAHGPREEMRNTTMTVEQKLLTPKEVARWLDVSIDWVLNHATRQEYRLPVVRIGKLLRWRLSRGGRRGWRARFGM